MLKEVATAQAAVNVAGQTNALETVSVVAPISEIDREILNTYLPIGFQLLGGGSSTAECDDGRDNDGDGKTDYPEDEDCQSKTDISEGD